MAGWCEQKTCCPCWRNVLGIAGLVTILGGRWATPSFSRAGSALSGGLKFAFLQGVDARPNADYSYWVSQNVFAMYQLMFAIITPALIVGAVAERMKFAAVLVFVGIWMFLVYFPIAHMVWGIDGWMNGV
jgi:Amt family ammonium transporter